MQNKRYKLLKELAGYARPEHWQGLLNWTTKSLEAILKIYKNHDRRI